MADGNSLIIIHRLEPQRCGQPIFKKKQIQNQLAMGPSESYSSGAVRNSANRFVISMSDQSPSKADPTVLGLERYRARLGFWQAIWGTLITGGVAVAIPAAVDTYKARIDRDKAQAELRLKEREIELKRIDSHQQYISNFLNTALNQDIELRMRFSEYFSFVSDSNKDDWEKFRTRLEERRDIIRKAIHSEEKDVVQLRTSNVKLTVEQQTELARLERELGWHYAELGYVRKDSNVSAPVAPTTSTALDQSSITSENEDAFRGMVIDREHTKEIEDVATRISDSKARYEAVQAATELPWFVVGIAHILEANGNFTTHLNGDPLTAKTIHPPQGRPAEGAPPFPWESSAIDLIKASGLNRDLKPFSSLGGTLYLLERYNGFGYRRLGVKSPYIWGCTNVYTGGRYMPDGHFDRTAISRQCGAAPILKVLIDRQIVRF